MRRLEPTYPSFNLVVNEALDDPLRLPPYHSFHRRPHSHPAYGPARFEDPLMTTVNYGLQSTDDLSAVPELSFSDFWPPDEEAANLQAALENRRIAKGSISRRRSFSDLVIDLAHIIRRKCLRNPFKRTRKMPVLKAKEVKIS